jgi:trehalose 6-phosphate phosphatase
MLEVLARLRDRNDGAVALISGRAVADVDALFHPLRLPVAGQHGVERRDIQGRLHRHRLPDAGLRHAAQRLSQLVAQNQGLVFEDKGLNLAVHYRLAPQLASAVERVVRELLQQLGDQFELQCGKMVWEIKPSGRDKGTAVAEFMSEPPFGGRQPIFIGDDLTDEIGFAWVNNAGGHSIKVGAGPSQADWRLPDAAAVRRWLGELVRFLSVRNRP